MVKLLLLAGVVPCIGCADELPTDLVPERSGRYSRDDVPAAVEWGRKSGVIEGRELGLELDRDCVRREWVVAVTRLKCTLYKTHGCKLPRRTGYTAQAGRPHGHPADHCFCGFSFEAYSELGDCGIQLIDRQLRAHVHGACERSYAAGVLLQLLATDDRELRHGCELVAPRFPDVPLQHRHLVDWLVENSIIRVPEGDLSAWMQAPLPRWEMVIWLHNAARWVERQTTKDGTTADSRADEPAAGTTGHT